jgi:hypothetical protein
VRTGWCRIFEIGGRDPCSNVIEVTRSYAQVDGNFLPIRNFVREVKNEEIAPLRPFNLLTGNDWWTGTSQANIHVDLLFMFALVPIGIYLHLFGGSN